MPLLIGGDKTRDNQFYERIVAMADDLSDEHLETLLREGKRGKGGGKGGSWWPQELQQTAGKDVAGASHSKCGSDEGDAR